MLRALPFQTIGDIARHGLELHVYCPICYSTRQLLESGPVHPAILAFAAIRGRGSCLPPRIGQADTIAALEQPAFADSERERLSSQVIEAARNHPPLRLAIGRVM